MEGPHGGTVAPLKYFGYPSDEKSWFAAFRLYVHDGKGIEHQDYGRRPTHGVNIQALDKYFGG